MAGKETARVSMKERFWGRTAVLRTQVRFTALLLVLVSIVSLSFCQLGFWSIGDIAGMPVYLMLMLAPLVMGAFLFGPLTGALLGLFAGTVVFLHSLFFPLDFYEVYFMTPLNSFVLLTILGALAGLLFDLFLRRNPQGGVRAGLIIAASIVLSLAASGLVQLNTFIMYGGQTSFDVISEILLISPAGIIAQVLIDAATIALVCLVVDFVYRRLSGHGEGERRLLNVFRSWMLAVSLIVFMATSAVIFSAATWQCVSEASDAMISDVDYLVKQVASRDSEDYPALLDGYEVALDGYVVITDETAVILASDDEGRYPTGESFMKAIGYSYPEDEELERATLKALSDDEDVSQIQAYGGDGTWTMDIAFLALKECDGGYVAILRTSELVYRERFGIMFAATLLAVLLIVAIALVASRLLNTVVVRRIDETNESLERITEGDLSERVGIRDSREFSSLSAGINSTVMALKGTIEEVEQKNAQELAAAKAIQENALPTVFPAFPEIDTFDIYASMKTAKEVGGDFYDFFLIEDTTKVGFIMADVSGKGIPAALFMMTAKTQLQNYMAAGLPVSEAIDAANHQLCIGNEAGMFVTTWVGELDYETGELAYVNAGHNPPMLLHNGQWEWMRNVSGMPLGLFDGIPYESFTCQLDVGDMLYTYTDGVTEAMDADGNLFSEERLEETLRKYADFNPRSVCVGVRRAITDFTQDCEQSDDITMLGLKYGVPPETEAVMILPAKTEQLVHVCNYIHAELHRRNAPRSVYGPIDIAAEELFVNVCRYAYPDATPENPGEVRVSFEYEDNPPSLKVQMIDDGIPYNPLAKPDAVTPDRIEDVPIGGLGILMAKKSVDEMVYERDENSNVLTFRKGW